MKLPKKLTEVTLFSKSFAMLLFIILPFLGFYVGTQYQKTLLQSQQADNLNIFSHNTISQIAQPQSCHYVVTSCPTQSPNCMQHGGCYPCDPVRSLVCPTGIPSTMNTLLSYDVPSSWRLDTSNPINADILNLLSSDEAAGREGLAHGSVIEIEKISMGIYKTEGDYIVHINPAAEFTLIKIPMYIDSLQAYRYESKYNKFWITYSVFKNGFEWNISLISADQLTQQRYTPIFMNFLQSVHFK